MMTLVVPKLLEIFEDKSALPASTRTLVFISDMFINYWYIIIFLGVLIITIREIKLNKDLVRSKLSINS